MGYGDVSHACMITLIVAVSIMTLTEARSIVVGGSQQWRSGFNYTDWALKNGPFRINDTLVFKYDAPKRGEAALDVYQLPYLWSYIKCDFSRAKLVANKAQGEGNGFEFVLKEFRPHYFACSTKGAKGSNCNAGMMRFFVMPFPNWDY